MNNYFTVVSVNGAEKNVETFHADGTLEARDRIEARGDTVLAVFTGRQYNALADTELANEMIQAIVDAQNRFDAEEAAESLREAAESFDTPMTELENDLWDLIQKSLDRGESGEVMDYLYSLTRDVQDKHGLNIIR